MRIRLSAITLDHIYDGWAAEHGMGRFSRRWERAGKLMATDMTAPEAHNLADYLRKLLALVGGPGIEREPGLLPALRRDVARLRSL